MPMMNEKPMIDVLITLQDALGSQYGDLSRPQFRLMMKLGDSNPTVPELAERLNISFPRGDPDGG